MKVWSFFVFFQSSNSLLYYSYGHVYRHVAGGNSSGSILLEGLVVHFVYHMLRNHG